MTDRIKTSTADGVLTITLNRPDKKNALTQPMYAALADGLDTAAHTKTIRVVVINAEGDAFTAGNDVGDFMSVASTEPSETPVWRFLNAISTFEKPIIAAVSGLAVGVGVTLLLHCDLVYAVPTATFQTPFVDLGIVPEAGSSILMPRIMGSAKAADMLLNCRRFTAEEADRAGLLTAILPAEGFQDAVRERAVALARKAPESVRLTKALIRKDWIAVRERMDEERALFAERLKSAELTEAVTAFLEKRAPDFSKLG